MARRITVATAQLLGFDQSGGVGTATTFLTLALGRAGHEVDVLYLGSAGGDRLAPEWSPLFEGAGVTIRRLAADETVHPRRFGRSVSLERALRADPPDVVITHEFGAPAYAAQRLRQLGLGFGETVFVVFCHGTRRWVKEVTANANVSREVLLESVLEQASVELADAVVSPSAFMLGWMRGQGWSVPADARVIPYLTRSTATGERPPSNSTAHAPLRRVTFFGRLEEIKGIGPIIDAINAVEPELWERVELEFLGPPTKQWSQQRVEALVANAGRISFQGALGQQEALARLAEPGTVAVMPSLADNSPNTVYECLERGIAFLASDSGGIAELIAAEDRGRVLFDPIPADIATALRRVLTDRAALPARPAFDGAASLAAWSEVVATTLQAPVSSSTDDAGDWVVVSSDGDDANSALQETLQRAQAASGADVVTCGARTDGETWLFAGDAGGLGVVANHYGTTALIRRSLLDGDEDKGSTGWPLLARLHATGARIVSVPLPLVRRERAPGDVVRTPSDALLVVEEFERALPEHLRSLGRLVAGLTAEAGRRYAR
jgi:glycosyltransferase involved in cell wall biosynthesis